MERVTVTIYTDPGCPFGFNAQRQELQLAWHYGAGLAITRKMIVLNEKSAPFEERGLSREMIAASVKRLRSTYGMPMVTEAPDRLAATVDACRAYVGARIHDPPRAGLLLRNEVLSWAPYPLATAEIAELRGTSLDQARDELREAGAKLSEVAGDGYWSSQ